MSSPLALAETIRETCLRVALQAYENAGISGLCGEGRWEIAVQAMRSVELRPVVEAFQRDAGNAP